MFASCICIAVSVCSLSSQTFNERIPCVATAWSVLFQVRGLEFSTISPNLLASGADEGEICIWDLAAPTEPSHFPPLKVCSNVDRGS